jgi:uncharacterized protein
MDLMHSAALAASGLMAGFINAVAGGGTFFTFSALLLTGLPSTIANATSAVGVTPANIASTWAYLPELKAHASRFKTLLALSILGGAAGSFLLMSMEAAHFRAMVPWLLLAATALFAASPWLKKRFKPDPMHVKSWPSKLLGRLFQLVVSIYGGFFGAGMGIVMLAGLSLSENEDFHTLNALKNLLATLIQLVAIVLFIMNGIVDWTSAFIIMAFATGGGWLGVKWSRRVNHKTIQYFVIASGVILSMIFFIKD